MLVRRAAQGDSRTCHLAATQLNCIKAREQPLTCPAPSPAHTGRAAISSYLKEGPSPAHDLSGPVLTCLLALRIPEDPLILFTLAITTAIPVLFVILEVHIVVLQVYILIPVSGLPRKPPETSPTS